MIRINLLPVREAQRKERLRSQVSVLVLSLILTATICAVFYGSTLYKISDQRAENDALQQKINQLQSKIGKVNQYKKLKAEVATKLKILDKLKNRKKGPVRLMDSLSAALPDKVWFDEIDQKGGVFEIKGIAADDVILADFMQRLDASPYWSDVELKFVKRASHSGTQIRSFTLSAKIEEPAPSATVAATKR